MLCCEGRKPSTFSRNTFTRNGSKLNNYETRDSSKHNFSSHSLNLSESTAATFLGTGTEREVSWTESLVSPKQQTKTPEPPASKSSCHEPGRHESFHHIFS
ncbi:unnamed protein product [Protopolystoma xenopodis]|uniref:Uncharacterized protein n=1 Tax=Protopolystoma xenopodis TaxID=117903 RepID=A0A3S5B3N8_9PLAT|nr:unnamed protein product [Protopolystoma xenopodis]